MTLKHAGVVFTFSALQSVASVSAVAHFKWLFMSPVSWFTLQSEASVILWYLPH